MRKFVLGEHIWCQGAKFTSRAPLLVLCTPPFELDLVLPTSSCPSSIQYPFQLLFLLVCISFDWSKTFEVSRGEESVIVGHISVKLGGVEAREGASRAWEPESVRGSFRIHTNDFEWAIRSWHELGSALLSCSLVLTTPI